MTNESAEHLTQTSGTSAEPGVTRRVALAGAAGLVGTGIVGVAGARAQTDDATATAGEPSLYDRLGGIFAISAVVDRFSDEIITNPKLNVNPANGCGPSLVTGLASASRRTPAWRSLSMIA